MQNHHDELELWTGIQHSIIFCRLLYLATQG